MTRIALIADAHVANHRRWGGPSEGGLNVRGRECVDTLALAGRVAAEAGCSVLVVLGDLFDHTRPSPPLVSATIQALVRSGVFAHVILGNHDRQSMHPNDQACAPLDWVNTLDVVSSPRVVHLGTRLSVAMLPYESGEAKDWVPAALARVAPQFAPDARRVVLTHCGVWDDDTPPYLRSAKDAIGLGQVRWLCEAHGVDFFAAGNWHEPRTWRPRAGTRDPLVTIPGTICPHSFSDPAEHGIVVVYDSETNAWNGIRVPSPLFVTIGNGDLENWGQVGNHIMKFLETHHIPPAPPRAYVRLVAKSRLADRAAGVRDEIASRWPSAVITVEVEESYAAEVVRDAAKAAVIAAQDHATLLNFAELGAVVLPGTQDGVVRRLGEYRKAAG